MGFFDAFKAHSRKETSKEKMRKIRESGKFGERRFEQDNALSEIKRTPHGKDYEKTVIDHNGRKRVEHWEVKRNNSPLSEKQKKTRGLKVRRYVDTEYGFVEARTEDKNGNKIEKDVFTGKWNKVKKRNNDPFGTKSVTNNMFGMGSTRKSKNKNYSGFDNMFGTSTKSKKRSSNSWGF